MTPYELAKKEIGTVEWAKGDNPKVVAYFRDSGNPGVKSDTTAWCAAFVGAMLARAGVKPTGKLNARSYLDWGVEVDPANIMEGDVVVFKRGTSSWEGHVGFAAGKPKDGKIMVLGGNQSDAVNIKPQNMTAFLGARRAASKPVADKKPADPVVKPPPASGLWALLRAILKWLGGRK